MKKLILTLILTLAFTPLAFADSIPSNLEIFDETTVGAKVDLPNLVKTTTNTALGAEVGLSNLFEDWDQSGYVIVKFTYTGSLLDLTKKK